MKEETKNESNAPLAVEKVQQNQTESTTSKTEGNLYFFLMLIVGHWGVHKFITGKIGMGILYVFTLGLFGIGRIVDLFSFAAGNVTDADGKSIEATAGYKTAAKLFAILTIVVIVVGIIWGIIPTIIATVGLFSYY